MELIWLYVCHNPVFLHVISLTVPSSTEPVGLNPFDDEDDEEMPAKQPNSSPANVKKEEVVAKMLVNRKHLLLFCSRSLQIDFPLTVLSYAHLVCFLFAFIFPSFSLPGACCLSAWLHSVDHVLMNTRVHCVLCFFCFVFFPQCNLIMSSATVQSDLCWSVPKISHGKINIG